MEKTIDYIFDELKKIKRENRIMAAKQSLLNCFTVMVISCLVAREVIVEHKLNKKEKTEE